MSATELVDRFYTAFAARDGETMASLYADNARFSDPAFPDLNGKEAGAMWKMLTSRAADLKVEHAPPQQEGETVRTTWQAWYTFSATGRQVHNIIDAEITVRDGKIVKHTDRFPFWRWSRQALGGKGLLLGWTPIVKGAVQKQADKGLRIFMDKNGIVA